MRTFMENADLREKVTDLEGTSNPLSLESVSV